MKHKLTITVDEEVLSRARQDARSRGVSLSALIEQAIREKVGEDAPSFASRWLGAFRLAERDDPRYEALVRKYSA